MKNKIKFLKNFFEDGKVGAISASSKFLVDRVTDKIQPNLNIIIELGSGSGVMSKELLKKLNKNGILYLVENNENFVKEELEAIKDSRVVIFNGKAEKFLEENASTNNSVDLIISSIPLSFFTPAERKNLVKLVHTRLKVGGEFIIFHQYWNLVKKNLIEIFGNVNVSYEVRNILPCYIVTSVKKNERN